MTPTRIYVTPEIMLGMMLSEDISEELRNIIEDEQTECISTVFGVWEACAAIKPDDTLNLDGFVHIANNILITTDFEDDLEELYNVSEERINTLRDRALNTTDGVHLT